MLLIIGGDLEVTDRRMAPSVKLILAQPLRAGAPPLVCHMMGNRMFHRRPFAQGSATALGLKLGTQLLLKRLILADRQGPALPECGDGARRALGTRVTGTGRKLGGSAGEPRHGLAARTGNRPVGKVEAEGMLGEARASAGPGTGHNVHALLGPRPNPRACHGPQVDVQLQQALPLLQVRGDHLRVDWTKNVYARAQAMGVEIHLPRYQPRSTLPLASCLWAGEQGRLRELKHALYEAFFCEGEDISADVQIARAADRAGLDPDGAVRAAYAPELGERLQAIRREADAGGVRGVPTLLTDDGETHWGMGGVERLLTGERLVPRPA